MTGAETGSNTDQPAGLFAQYANFLRRSLPSTWPPLRKETVQMNRLCSSCTLTLTARAMWFHIVTGVLESEDQLLFEPFQIAYDSFVGPPKRRSEEMLQVFVRLMTQISCGLADSSLEIALIGFTFDRHLAATNASQRMLRRSSWLSVGCNSWSS